jgi:hypothetical protein
MNPLALLIGAAALGGLAMAAAAEKKPGTTPAPKPTKPPAGGAPPAAGPQPSAGLDVGQILVDAFNAAGAGQLTPDQIAKIKTALENLGTDANGKLTVRPPIWARDEAFALCDELDRTGVPLIGAAIRTMVYAADKLPESTKTDMQPMGKPALSGPWGYATLKPQGPWNYLGSFSREECGSFGDWWDGFISKWSSNWWRR